MKNFIINRLKDKTIKGIEWKLLINNAIFLILILFMFKGVYQTAEIINYEIQFQNYLDNMNKPSYYKVDSYQNEYGLYNISREDEKILNESLAEEPDKLEFPKSFKYLIGLTFFLLLNSMYYVIYLHKKIKNMSLNDNNIGLSTIVNNS